MQSKPPSRKGRIQDRAFALGVVKYLTLHPEETLLQVARAKDIGRSTLTRIIGAHAAFAWLQNEPEWKQMRKSRNGNSVIARSARYAADEHGVVPTERDGEPQIPVKAPLGRVVIPRNDDVLRNPQTGEMLPSVLMHLPQPARVPEAVLDALVASGGGVELDTDNARSFGQYLGSYTAQELVGHHPPVTEEQANRAAQAAVEAQRSPVPRASAEHAFSWTADGKQGAIFRGVIFMKFADGDVRITNATPGKVTTEIANMAGLLTSLYPYLPMRGIIENAVDWHDMDAVINAANNPGHEKHAEAVKLVDIAIGGPAARAENAGDMPLHLLRAMRDEEETPVPDDNNASVHYTDFPGQAWAQAEADVSHAANTLLAVPDPEAAQYQEYQAGNHKPAPDPRMLEVATAMLEIVGMEALGVRPVYQEPDTELRAILSDLEVEQSLMEELRQRLVAYMARQERNN